MPWLMHGRMRWPEIPISAFGGVLITNREIDLETAEEMNKIFFEVVIAPSYTEDALKVLQQKKNRIILIQKSKETAEVTVRTVLNGVILSRTAISPLRGEPDETGHQDFQ